MVSATRALLKLVVLEVEGGTYGEFSSPPSNNWDIGLWVQIWISRLGLSLVAEIWVSRLRFWPPGRDFGSLG